MKYLILLGSLPVFLFFVHNLLTSYFELNIPSLLGISTLLYHSFF